MNFKNTFIPLEEDFDKKFEGLSCLGASTSFYTEQFPNLEGIEIALIGIYIKEDSSLLAIRNELYKYRVPWNTVHIADLGNLKNPEAIQLKEITQDLLEKKICPILIGGDQSVDLVIHQVYQSLDERLDITLIDNQIDLDSNGKSGHLQELLLDQPSKIENLNLLGFQTYLVNEDQFKIFEKLNFETLRLGELKKNLDLAEPLLRGSNYCSFDTKAIKNQYLGNPKGHFFGLDGEEACQLSWYAGMNEKMQLISFNEFPENINHSESQLLSTLIWYYIEGYYSRRETYNFESELYQKFTTSLVETDQLISFYKSNISGRWWFEANGEHLPCAYQDYVDTANGELPNRVFKAFF